MACAATLASRAGPARWRGWMGAAQGRGARAQALRQRSSPRCRSGVGHRGARAAPAAKARRVCHGDARRSQAVARGARAP
eukprot:11213537-Lingulodinium_polyedra.AAC.1